MNEKAPPEVGNARLQILETVADRRSGRIVDFRKPSSMTNWNKFARMVGRSLRDLQIPQAVEDHQKIERASGTLPPKFSIYR